MYRSELDAAVMVADDSQPHRHRAGDREARSSSPGLLAFIPFTVADNAVSANSHV